MKDLEGFWFFLALCMSMLVVVLSFMLAYTERGYLALGGEVFMLALPLIVVFLRIRENRIIKMTTEIEQMRITMEQTRNWVEYITMAQDNLYSEITKNDLQ